MNETIGLRINTMNARSCFGGSKIDKNNLNKYLANGDQKINILCLQEHLRRVFIIKTQ
jgi:hypothetical protein